MSFTVVTGKIADVNHIYIYKMTFVSHGNAIVKKLT